MADGDRRLKQASMSTSFDSIFSSVTSDPGVRGLGKSARAGVLGAAPYRTGRGWTTEQHRGDPGWAPAAGARVCSAVTSQ